MKIGEENSNGEIGRKVFEVDAGSGIKNARVFIKGVAAKRV